MLGWDETLIANAFAILANQNIKYSIFIATDNYGIDINNTDITLVI